MILHKADDNEKACYAHWSDCATCDAGEGAAAGHAHTISLVNTRTREQHELALLQRLSSAQRDSSRRVPHDASSAARIAADGL